MAKIGRENLLEVVKLETHGAYLQGGWLGEILLPKRYVPEDCEIGDPLNVFVYLDSEDRYIATTQTPKAQVGEVAYLECISVNKTGAFFDWGLPKDLLVPFSEQHAPLRENNRYLVYLYSDPETHRIAASSKLNKYINRQPTGYQQGDKVDLLINEKTDIGYSSVINHQDWGVLFYSDVVKPLKIGQKVAGFIKRVREDGKIDLSLHAPGFVKIDILADKVLKLLHKNQGFLALSDKSPPDAIYDALSVSKKSYKTAIGTLYKKKLIRIEAEGIYLITDTEK
ncbi:MAG: S1 RNA-binding domain-containing protein [Oleiphilus sp.]